MRLLYQKFGKVIESRFRILESITNARGFSYHEKKKFYFCNSFEQITTALKIIEKYPKIKIITPSNSVYSHISNMGFEIRKINVSSKVIRPRFFMKI